MHNKSTPASSSTSSSGGGGGEGQSGAESTSAPVGPSVSKTSSTTGTEKVNRYSLSLKDFFFLCTFLLPFYLSPTFKFQIND